MPSHWRRKQGKPQGGSGLWDVGEFIHPGQLAETNRIGAREKPPFGILNTQRSPRRLKISHTLPAYPVRDDRSSAGRPHQEHKAQTTDNCTDCSFTVEKSRAWCFPFNRRIDRLAAQGPAWPLKRPNGAICLPFKKGDRQNRRNRLIRDRRTPMAPANSRC